MAKSTAAIEIEVLPKGGADATVKNFKTQLKEAKNEAQQMVITFGEFSNEALEAQKKVAQLADKMEDFNDRVKALNPDKFSKVQTVVSGVARGFQAAQGAMALFGSESEELQKTLAKVQGAMALADGLEGLGKVQQQFMTLAKDGVGVLVKSFSTLKGALISTGIGALVVALGYVITNFDELGLSIKSDAEKADDLVKSNDKLKESMDLTSQSIEAETELLKEQGASLQKINDLKIKSLQIANETLKGQQNEIAVTQASLEKLFDVTSETAYVMSEEEQKSYDELEERRIQNANSIKKNEAIILNLKAEVIKEGQDQATKANEKADAKRKEQEAKQKDAATKEVKAIQEKNEALRKLDEANATEGLDFITTQFANNLSRLQESKAQELNQENLSQEAKLAIQSKYNTLIQTNEVARVKASNDFTKAQAEKESANALIRQAELLAIGESTIEQQVALADAQFALKIKGLQEQGYAQIEIDKLRDAALEKVRSDYAEKVKSDAEKLAEQQQKDTDAANEILLKAYDEYYATQILQVRQSGKTKEEIEKEVAQLEIQNLEAKLVSLQDSGDATIEIETQIFEKKKAIKDKEAADDLLREKTKQEGIYNIANSSLSALSSLNEAFASDSEESQKRAFEIDKALKYASTIMSTIEGTQSAFTTANKSPITAIFPAYPYVQAGAALAFGLANLKKISDTKYQSKSTPATSGGNRAAGGGEVPQMAAPRMSSLGNGNELTQDRRVYVTEGDISRTQKRVSNNQSVSVVE